VVGGKQPPLPTVRLVVFVAVVGVVIMADVGGV